MEYINLTDIEGKKIENSEIAIINCPVGYGKTHLAANELPQYFKSTFPLLSVPTKAIKWQTISDYKSVIQLDNGDLAKPNQQEKGMRVCCFSAIAQGLADGNEINSAPDLLILDEIDELAKWSMCFDGYLLAGDWVLSNRDKIKIIGLTATPELLTDYVESYKFVNIARDLEPKYKARTIEVIQHSSIITYLKTQEYSEDSKVIVYLQSAKQCVEMALKYPNAGFMVSEYNTDKIKVNGKEKELKELMKEQIVNDGNSEQTNLRDYVLNEKKLPHGYNLLFFNDSAHTGMNIKDETVKTVICETVDSASIIQAIGRVRHDLEKVTVITNNRNKKPFFQDLERAKEFFLDERIDLYTGWKMEQEQIKKAKRDSARIDFDILTYQDSKGNIKVNPFAKACYEYIFDIYRKLEKPGTAKQYFDNMLCPLSMTGNVIYVSADEIKANAANKARFDESVIAEYLNRDLFKADKEELADRLKLIDKWRDVRGWTTVKKHLKENGYQVNDYNAKKNPRTGKRERYSVVTI